MDSITQNRSFVVSAYLSKNKDYFNDIDMNTIYDALASCDQQHFDAATRVPLKDPNTMKIVSFLLGIAGIDRFMLKDKFFGLLKLFTFGGLLLLWWSDYKNIEQITRVYNAANVVNAACPGAVVEKSNNEKLRNVTGFAKTFIKNPAVKDGFKKIRQSAKEFGRELDIR